MTYETFTEFNDSSIAGLFLYPAQVVPAFVPLILVSLFLVALMTTYFSQRRLTGRGDFTSSFAVSGYFVTVVAFIMSLITNLVNIITVTICLSISIVGTILLLISKR